MSNYNGVIIYIDTSTDPDTGVSFADVQTVLGTNADTEIGLCTHENINKWARYKPERHNGPMPVSYSSRKANNFGLEVPFCNEYGANVMNFMVYNFVYNYGEEGWHDLWNYLKPRGDRRQAAQNPSAEFYRLSDFARLPSDTTDPNYGSSLMATRGYNKNARLPFNVSMDDSGCRYYYDTNKDVWVYEVNKQVSNEIVFTFYNSIGDDLHLQDFVTLPNNGDNVDDNTIAWRPIVQVFNDYKRDGEDEWYERHNAQYEIAGDAITSDPKTIWQVSLDLEDSNFDVNQFYHVCVGVGYCKKDPTAPNAWGSETNALFLPPYLTEKADLFEFPFYYIIKPVSYMARTLNVVGLQFFANGIQRWENASGTAPYFTIHSLASGYIFLTMEISKLPSQQVDFISENGTATSGYAPLRIQAREMVTGTSGETTTYLSPANENKQAASHTLISSGQTDETQTIYATLNISDIPVNGYGEFHIYANTGGSDLDNIGYFSIHKIQYS